MSILRQCSITYPHRLDVLLYAQFPAFSQFNSQSPNNISQVKTNPSGFLFHSCREDLDEMRDVSRYTRGASGHSLMSWVAGARAEVSRAAECPRSPSTVTRSKLSSAWWLITLHEGLSSSKYWPQTGSIYGVRKDFSHLLIPSLPTILIHFIWSGTPASVCFKKLFRMNRQINVHPQLGTMYLNVNSFFLLPFIGRPYILHNLSSTTDLSPPIKRLQHELAC